MGDICVITEPCIGVKSGDCVDICPVEAIKPLRSDPQFEGAEMLYIDPATCIGCGACEPACPVTAIFELWAVPDKWKPYIEKNAGHFRSPVDEAASAAP